MSKSPEKRCWGGPVKLGISRPACRLLQKVTFTLPPSSFWQTVQDFPNRSQPAKKLQQRAITSYLQTASISMRKNKPKLSNTHPATSSPVRGRASSGFPSSARFGQAQHADIRTRYTQMIQTWLPRHLDTASQQQLYCFLGSKPGTLHSIFTNVPPR